MQTNSQRHRILSSIKDLFDAEAERRKQGLCEHCGSSMQFLDAQFQLYGTPITWQIRLPFCQVCESDTSTSLLM